MGIRSTLRSRITSTGLEVEIPAAEGADRDCEEKRLSLELRTWSRSFRSSFVAIISAAAPLGQRIWLRWLAASKDHALPDGEVCRQIAGPYDGYHSCDIISPGQATMLLQKMEPYLMSPQH